MGNETIPVFTRLRVNNDFLANSFFYCHTTGLDVHYGEITFFVADHKIGPGAQGQPGLIFFPDFLSTCNKRARRGVLMIIGDRATNVHRGQIGKAGHDEDTTAIALPSTLVPSSVVTRSAKVAEFSCG